MNDNELERLLRAAKMPERPADHWQKFPGKVVAELERRKFQKHRDTRHVTRRKAGG